MPNHLHTIIIINETQNVGVELALPKEDAYKGRASSAPTNPTLGRIIQVFKSISTIEINRFRGVSGIPVWQRNYYEHIIRNDKELYEVRKYIEINPLNWENDEYHK